MGNIINTVIGDMSEKKSYKENEKRAKALPTEYSEAYKDIKHYIFSTAGITSMEPLKVLVDILEEAAADGKSVVEGTR